MPLKIVVLGAGAVGAYYAGQLARRGHEVTCFARGANLEALREQGLEIRTPEGVVRPRVAATDRVEQLGPADFGILAVKSYSLRDITPVVRHVALQGATVVPFLNGVETAERLVAQGVPRAALVGGSDANQRGARTAGCRGAAQPISDRRRGRAQRGDDRPRQPHRHGVPRGG